MSNYCVIMAGGIGSRFWPWSRQERPKQFLDILGTGKSLIRQTFERFESFIPAENVYVVTNRAYKDQVLEHLPELRPEQVLLEPEMRNTAPCIAYASYKIKKIDPNANIVVTPSDHLITNTVEFASRISEGLEFVSQGSLLTLGIQPSRPDTGYGYIEFDKEDSASVKDVVQFREKPSIEKAEEYLQAGNFLWNSGIFLWSVGAIVEEFEKHLPEMASLFEAGIPTLNTPEEEEFINSEFGKCENISIDYGIMERAERIGVMPCDFGWSDLGTWGSLYDKLEKDENGNAAIGENYFLNESKNVLVKPSPDKKVVVQGLSDIIVIDTEDTILICNKNDEQKVKQLVAKMKEVQG